MTDAEKREAARQFYQKWHDKGREDEDDRSYWIDFLQNILGVENVTDRVKFQKKVIDSDGHTKRIDAYIPETRVLIEQKSLGIDLSKEQAGHNNKTPYEQAKEYDNFLPVSEKAKWIVLSNFEEIWVYDMDVPVPRPEKFTLEQIPLVYNKFEFLVNKEEQRLSHEMEISIKAGEFVGLIYDALSKQYLNPESEDSQKSLNILCVRLVFCLYAEDAHIFGDNGHMFHDYMDSFATKDMRNALRNLFKTLNTPEEQRDRYDAPELLAFPYVNGGLFEKEDVEIPNFTEEIRSILLSKASEGFDWSDISPTIFGAVFESTLNPETRRSGGMHYTSIENIHKVIDPLFLDDLKAEFEEIKGIQVLNSKRNKLEAFQNKLASLTWLDPAAGSGNFLTETFLCIRELENQVIRGILDCKRGSVEGQIILDVTNPIKVSINQFYGIEINDFAVTVAKTALWIAESQMIKKTEDIVHRNIDFLPLKTNANIVEGNALRINWEDVVPKSRLNYIMGNPPFVARAGRISSDASSSRGMLDEEQKEDRLKVFNEDLGNVDYVACWFKKSSTFTKHTKIKTAFVATDSICQGQQIYPIWNNLLKDGIHIDFAYKFFRWDSEAVQKATVYVVIVGFSHNHSDKAVLFNGSDKRIASHISPYLIEADNDILVESRNKPLCDVPLFKMGNQPIDNGYYLFTYEEMCDFIKTEPASKKYFKKWIDGAGFLNNNYKYCLWLGECTPAQLKSMPKCLELVSKVKEYRLKSNRKSTKKLADTPTRFQTENMPNGNYVVVPEVSSGNRVYIPMAFLDSNTLCSNKLRLMNGANLYHFGVLQSNVHMAWTKTVCGYYGPSYQYSINIVYNNFPWSLPTKEQKEKIEKTAQKILDARLLYPDSTLAELYDPLTMPIELLRAHKENDRAVMEAYGFNVKNMSEEDCVAELMKMYKKLTEENHAI